MSHDYIKDLYLLFRNNTVYVSNFICDDDYTRVYPRFLYEQDTGRETWRGSYFTGKEVVSLRSDVNVYSHYATPQRYQALVCTVDVYPHTFANQRSALVCNFDFGEFVSDVVSPDILDSCVFYIKENGGRIIASYNVSEEELASGISPQKYEVITSGASALGYQIVLGVPQKYLNRRAGASFFIIPVYFFIGLAAIFLLSLLFSVKETNAMGTVIRTASALFPTSEPSDGPRNEYAYISGILKTSATELEDINRLLKTSALENLFLNSSPINSDRNYIRLFQSAFDFYCVAVIRLTDHRDEELHRLYFYFLADSCKGILQETFFQAHTSVDELSLLIPLDKEHNCDLSDVREELFRVLDLCREHLGDTAVVHIGLSTIASGSDHIRETYLQARDAIHMYANINSSGLFVYNNPRQITLRKTLDVSLLTKCYDGILYGDEQVVESFFSHIDRLTQKGYYDRQEPLQLLFSIRQPIYNAYIEIFASGQSENEETGLTPPVIELQRPLTQNIAQLKEFAFRLCRQIQAQKRQRQRRMEEDILNFIRTECFDVNFSAFTAASAFHVSENYIQQLVRESTGKSLKNFIESLRVEKAEELLRTTRDSNAKIAAACGFVSENTFYRAFARKHGVTPSKWSGGEK